MAKTPVSVPSSRSGAPSLPLPPPPPAPLPRPEPPVVPPETLASFPMPGERVFQEVVQRILVGNRQDFVEEVARWLRCTPDEESLRALAHKQPDRFMQGLTMVARMAGLTTERSEVYFQGTLATFVAEITSLSDAELLARRAHLALPPTISIP